MYTHYLIFMIDLYKNYNFIVTIFFYALIVAQWVKCQTDNGKILCSDPTGSVSKLEQFCLLHLHEFFRRDNISRRFLLYGVHASVSKRSIEGINV